MIDVLRLDVPRRRWRFGAPVMIGGAYNGDVGDLRALRGFYVRFGTRCYGLVIT